jgi:hypothetical protein
MNLLIPLIAAVVVAATRKPKTPKPFPVVTEGSAFLEQGKTYRIELEVGGPALTSAADHPSIVAQGVDAGLRMAGAYNVYISPTTPLQISYSLVAQGSTPVVLNVPTTQLVTGIPADYTFRSVQQIPDRAPYKSQTS